MRCLANLWPGPISRVVHDTFNCGLSLKRVRASTKRFHKLFCRRGAARIGNSPGMSRPSTYLIWVGQSSRLFLTPPWLQPENSGT